MIVPLELSRQDVVKIKLLNEFWSLVQIIFNPLSEKGPKLNLFIVFSSVKKFIKVANSDLLDIREHEHLRVVKAHSE